MSFALAGLEISALSIYAILTNSIYYLVMQKLVFPNEKRYRPQPWVVYRLCTIASANAVAVVSLYLGQILAKTAASDFPSADFFTYFVPGATLVGYAAGVALIAFSPANKVRLSIPAHLGLLSLALCTAGLTCNSIALAIASVFIGAGAAVAQRLLAAAGGLGGASHGGIFIGTTICTALIAVVGVRMTGETFAELVGWRAIFFFAAVIAACFSLLNRRHQTSPHHYCPTIPTSVGRLVSPLWGSSTLLRWAVFQHGAMFAAYNVAWMTMLLEVSARERAAVVIGGGGTGVIMALLAGHCVDRFAKYDLPRYGVTAVVIATSLLLPAAYSTPPGYGRDLLLLSGMALVDGGLQVALVANHTRVQRLLPNARSRLAALLTTCGSLGGAAAACLTYWLWHHFGWEPAIGLGSLTGLMGLGCASIAGSKQLKEVAALSEQDDAMPKPPCPIPSPWVDAPATFTNVLAR